MKKILIFDIETSLMEVYTHYIGQKVSVMPTQIKKHSKIICIGYKWLGESKVHHLQWDPKTQDDSKMLEKFNEIARKADAMIAHNGQGFDAKEIRGAIALRGLPMSWCETPIIDTLRDYRRTFRFKSNRLDAIAAHLGLDRKSPMGMQDWIDINNNKRGALSKMVKYCKQDVTVLEAVYLRLKDYIIPTAAELRLRQVTRVDHGITCPSCGSSHIIKNGVYSYKKTLSQRYLCKDCFTIIRG